jgi:hypothetical protein
MEVLSESLAEQIDGRHVRAAVFTTFTFDPEFFELRILPVLFDQAFHQADKVRRKQLEDAIEKVDIAVYYDRSGLVQDAKPAHLDYRRIDVRRPRRGCFHPKVVLVLVDDPPAKGTPNGDRPCKSLVVMVSSANLTREGWWENVECAHIEEIRDRERDDSWQPFRQDLLGLIRRVREWADEGEDHRALDAIHGFLLDRVSTWRPVKARAGGRYHTRLFYGQNQESLAGWLASINIHRSTWNLEVISPFFDPTGPGPLPDLIETINPRQTRVYLPRDLDGEAQVTKATYDGIAALRSCHWGTLAPEVVQRGKSAENLPPRGVHAKVYRLWSMDNRQVVLVGSVNLTSSAHSHAGAGNLEAAFFVDCSENGFPMRWWLESVDQPPKHFVADSPAEDDGLIEVPIDLSLRFDWATGTLSYRLMSGDGIGFDVSEVSGRLLFRVDNPVIGSWCDCPEDWAASVRDLLPSTSILCVIHARGTWRLLVREENVGYRPPTTNELTPEEILEYWASPPQQRALFIEQRGAEGADIEGLELGTSGERSSRQTIFQRFAGIYHSFGCLRKTIREAIHKGCFREAETKLLGARYDSLPCLLEKLLGQEDGDPITRYVTFLCARQLRDETARRYRDFFRDVRERTHFLDRFLEQVPRLRDGLAFDDESATFLAWYESAFLRSLDGGESTR